ncbi:MAG: GEVED domain-containing protein [Phormidesmis sp.]
MKAPTRRIFSPAHAKKNSKQQYLRPFVGAALISAWMLPAFAGGTAAGTSITNTAYGSFENPANAGTTIPVQSNTVTLTIAEVAGISVSNQGVVEAASGVTGAGPAQGDGVIGSNDVVYFTFRITNIGNDQTQFFIPNAPANVTKAAFGAVGPIKIVGYNNGTATTPLNINVNTGAATGTITGIPNGGSVPVNGYIDVQVPVKANANLVPGTDNITVVLGNTVSQAPANQNVQLVNGGAFGAGAGKDVYTQDNPGNSNGDFAGSPAFEREASSSQATLVGAAKLDYGDAPDVAAGTATGDYESAPDRGPSHVVGSIYLGTVVDAETTFGQDKGPPPEDNGVVINNGGTTPSLHGQSLTAGQSYTLDVTTVGTGKISAWIDFNRNGNFEDPGEKIATDVASTGGTQSITVNVPFGAVAGSTYARFRYSSQTGLTSTNAAPDGEVEDYNVTLVSSAPAFRLVKRITSIGGTAITSINDDPLDTNDNSPRWPANYLQGSFAGLKAEPGQAVDYTVYFLSDGNTSINQVKLCDLVPNNTTYVAGSLKLSQGGAAPAILTDAAGDDPGESFNSSAVVTAPCPGTTSTDGGVRVNVPGSLANATGPGTPITSYGFIRFTVTVD